MRIVVLLKAVPVVGNERLGDGFLVDRGVLEANGGDEYVLETALKLTETHGGDVTVLSMGPVTATEAIRKALAMGAARGVLVRDDAIAGSCTLATGRILAAALSRLEFDLALAGADTSDGQGGVAAAAIATRLGLPYLSYAASVEVGADGATVRVRRIAASGYDLLEAPLPALVMGTQLLGEPRYPSLRGIMQARGKEILTWDLAELGIDPGTVGNAAATTRVLDAAVPPPRAGAVFVREQAPVAAERIVTFLASRSLV